MNEATFNRASSALKAEGVLDGLLELLMKVVADLLANCGQSDEEIEASLNSPSLYLRWNLRNLLWRELLETYGAGAWIKHDGEGLLRKLLAAGKKAKPEDFAALRAA